MKQRKRQKAGADAGRLGQRGDTLSAVFGVYLKRHAQPKMKSAKEVERTFRKDVEPHIGDKNIADVTRADAVALIDTVADRGAPVGADALRAIMSGFYSWAERRGYEVSRNPFSNIDRASTNAPRQRILTDDEIKLLWQAADAVGYPEGPFVKLLLLTACRRDEIGRAAWGEFDDDSFNLPARRSKNGKAHKVPLVPTALEALELIPRIEGNDFLFIQTRDFFGGYAKAKTKIDAAMSDIAGESVTHWTFHDLRRTAASVMAREGVEPHVVELCLNHQPFSAIQATYNRFDYYDSRKEAHAKLERAYKLILES